MLPNIPRFIAPIFLAIGLVGCDTGVSSLPAPPAIPPAQAWNDLWATYERTAHDSISLDGMASRFLGFESMYPTNPRAAEAAWWAGYVTYLQRRWPDAATNFRGMVQRHPTSVYVDNSLHYLARCLVEQGIGDQARDSIRHFLANPKYSTSLYRAASWYYLGRAYMVMGKNDSARRIFALVRDSFPLDTVRIADATYETGKAWYSDSIWTTAQDWFGKVIDSFPTVEFRQDNAMYWYARCQHRRNHEDSAIPGYRNLIARYPTSSYADQAAYHIGVAFYDLAFRVGPAEFYDSAIISEANFLGAYPSSSYRDDGIYEQGKSHYRLGQPNLAEPLMDSVIAWNPASNVQDYALYYKSRILGDAGNCSGASNVVSRLLAAYPQSAALVLARTYAILNGCVVP